MTILFQVLEWVTGSCLIFYGFYLIWLAFHYVTRKSVQQKNSNDEFVSVIVPARNEAENIVECLNGLLNQNVPSEHFEVIVVNDRSEDNTRDLVHEMAEKYSNLFLVDLQAGSGKKAALTAGIKRSRGKIILTTDADCTHPSQWLSSMRSCFDQRTGLVSGPVELKAKGKWMGYFQALEFMGLNAVGAASIESGHPNMCNGANLGFRKEAWNEVGGYSTHMDLPSGDDELLMHAIHSTGNWKIRYCFDASAIVRTGAQPDWASFRDQRIRWVSKSRKYDRKSLTLVLALSYFGFLFFPVTLIHALWEPAALGTFALGMAWKMIAELCLLVPAAAFFHKLRHLIWFVPEQVLHILYVLWIGIKGNIGSYSWKGRRVQINSEAVE